MVIAGAPGARERTGGFMLHHQARTVDTQASLPRNHLRPGGAERSRDRAGARSRACCARARAFAAGLHRIAARHGRRARRAGRGAAAPRAPTRRRSPNAPTKSSARLRAKRDARCMMVDVEIRRYGIENRVAALARKLGVPVVTTFMGRGLLETRRTSLLGTYLGAAGDADDQRGWSRRPTLLLLLGVILSDTNFALSQRRRIDPRARMLAIDRDGAHRPSRLSRHPARRAGRGAARRAPRRSRRAPRTQSAAAYRARPAGRRQADRAVRRRERDQRPVRPPRRDADDLRHRRLPVHRDGDREHRRWPRPATTPAWASACRPASASRRRPDGGR